MKELHGLRTVFLSSPCVEAQEYPERDSDEGWQDLLAEHQMQRAQARQLRVSVRFEATLSSLMLLLLRFRPPPPIPTPQPILPPAPRPVEPAATLPGSSRPSAHHPWKKGPACRPKLFAKK